MSGVNPLLEPALEGSRGWRGRGYPCSTYTPDPKILAFWAGSKKTAVYAEDKKAR